MNKTEFISVFAEKTNATKAHAGEAVNAFLESITETLKKGDSITFPGFGTFSVSERSERQGRNPKTGEVITIQAKNVAKFKPGKGLDLA